MDANEKSLIRTKMRNKMKKKKRLYGAKQGAVGGTTVGNQLKRQQRSLNVKIPKMPGAY